MSAVVLPLPVAPAPAAATASRRTMAVSVEEGDGVDAVAVFGVEVVLERSPEGIGDGNDESD